jgi:hypothetical protein
MIRHCLAIAVVLMLTGCASQSAPPESNSAVSSQAQTPPTMTAPSPAELGAYAGSHPYPSSMPTREDLKAAAIVNTERGFIKIYNFSSDAIREADVWVNQGYVRHVSAIPPNSSITIPLNDLYNGVGQLFSARGEHVNRVEIQTDHDMQKLWGPSPQ